VRELSNNELSQLTNNELRQLFLKVRAVINSFKKNKERCTKKEIYFCYISEELNSRDDF